jgi:hypothetical protein
MRKITTKADANHFYELVNSMIDRYVGQWGIRPSKLGRYMRNETRLASFLKWSKLDDVEGIRKVVADVLEDREYMEQDKVVRFESFSLNESLNLSSSAGHERAAAEFYKVSLGHVDPRDGTNSFEVDDMGDKRICSVISAEDLKKLRSFVVERCMVEAESTDIDLHDADLKLPSGKRVKTRITIPARQVIDKEQLAGAIEKALDGKRMKSIIEGYLNDYPVLKGKKKYEYKGKTKVEGMEYEVYELTS